MREQLHAGRASVSVFTTPHATGELDPEQALVELIDEADHSVLFAVYSFTLPGVGDALIRAHGRGVTVRGVGDTSEWGKGAHPQFPRLAAAGLDVRELGSAWHLMHLKLAIVDGRYVALGSYNWTGQAESQNREALVVMSGSKVAVSTFTAQLSAAYDAGT